MHVEQQEQVLDVARELFFELGFFKTKVSEIAARSETSTASIYKVFPSKDAVFWAVIERSIGQIKHQIKQLAPISDPLSFLHHVAQHYQELCETELFKDLVRVPLHQNQLPDSKRRILERWLRTAIADLCLPALRSCGQRGLIDPDRMDSALALLSSFIEHHTIWHNYLTAAPVEKSFSGNAISEEAVRITLSAYGPSRA
jgi:AcrR family transcriptional regulator